MATRSKVTRAQAHARVCAPITTRTRVHTRTQAPARTHTQRYMYYLLLFRCNSGFANAPKCYRCTYIACFVFRLTFYYAVFYNAKSHKDESIAL